MLNDKPHILLVEDNKADAVLTFKAFEKIFDDIKIDHADSAEQALDALRSYKFKNQLPDIIILDMNLPMMSGKEFLQTIKNDPRLLHIPVVVFTNTMLHVDVLESYKRQAAGFFTKPQRLKDFVRFAKAIKVYWFTSARLNNYNILH